MQPALCFAFTKITSLICMKLLWLYEFYIRTCNSLTLKHVGFIICILINLVKSSLRAGLEQDVDLHSLWLIVQPPFVSGFSFGIVSIWACDYNINCKKRTCWKNDAFLCQLDTYENTRSPFLLSKNGQHMIGQPVHCYSNWNYLITKAHIVIDRRRIVSGAVRWIDHMMHYYIKRIAHWPPLCEQDF